MKQSSLSDVLREIVLFSGDVQPQPLKEWMAQADSPNAWKRNEWLFDNPAPFIAHLPNEFTDFCLQLLLEDDENYNFERETELGFSYGHKFFPPAHLKPPFMMLLNREEGCGLRLIHGVVNAGVSRWKQLAESGNAIDGARRPLPVKIEIDGQIRELWGDEQVYRWFRSYEVVSSVIRVALMALEAWMEEQIEQGRAADELFSRVLRDSECVASIGVCLSVACAYPNACLDAVWPMLANSRVWRIDIARLVNDKRYPDFWNDGLSAGLDGMHFARQLREQRPQRELDVQFLAHIIVLSSAPRRNRLFNLTRAFQDDLPFLTEEERDNASKKAQLHRDMRTIDAAIRPENQKVLRVGNELHTYVQLPDELGEEQRSLAQAMNDQALRLKLDFWSKFQLGRTLAPGAEVLSEESRGWPVTFALQLARALGDASTIEAWTFTLDPLQNLAVNPGCDLFTCNAITGVAVAALVTAAEELDQSAFDWCRSVVLAACKRADYLGFIKELVPLRALGALVTMHPSDMDARVMLVHFALSLSEEWSAQVVLALEPLWEQESVFCWNTCALVLHAGYKPRKEFEWAFGQEATKRWTERRKALFEKFAHYCENNEFMSWPRLFTEESEWREMWLSDQIYRPVLDCLPLGNLVTVPEGKAALLQLTEDLMRWTLANNPSDRTTRWNRDPQKPRLREASEMIYWNDFWGRWLARLSVHLTSEEWQACVFEPMRPSWSDDQSLFVNWLHGVIRQELASSDPLRPELVRQWRMSVHFVFDQLRTMAPDARRWWMNLSGNANLAAHLIFVNSGPTGPSVLLPGQWPHVFEFEGEVNEWVELLGSTPPGCVYLCLFLSSAGWSFTPEPALRWLFELWDAVPTPSAMAAQYNCGSRSTGLARRIWNEYRADIMAESILRQRLAHLLDILVSAGVTEAALLRSEVETASGEPA